jgi:hypothetical protein
MKNDKRFFQFLAGERKEEIVIFDKIEQEDDVIYVTFTDGSRVNEEFIQDIGVRTYQDKYMAEIEDPSNPWTFEVKYTGRQEEKTAKDADGKIVIVQPFIEGKKKIIPKPPKKLKSSFGKINEVHETPKPKEEKVITDNPVWLMLDKAKKFDTNVDLTITLSLPSKSLYDVANESFENGGNDVIDYIINHITDTKIKDSLKAALQDAYYDPKLLSENILDITSTEIVKPVTGDPVMMGKSLFVSEEDQR